MLLLINREEMRCATNAVCKEGNDSDEEDKDPHTDHAEMKQVKGIDNCSEGDEEGRQPKPRKDDIWLVILFFDDELIAQTR